MRAGKENETALKVWIKTCPADSTCVIPAAFYLEETTTFVFKAWLGFCWGPHWILLVLIYSARRSNSSIPCPGKCSDLSGQCWECLPQTQEIFLSRDSPTWTLLGFSYKESHSIGRYWRRTRLYFPREPGLTDFLAACNPIPVLSQWDNKHLLSSCFAWLWGQSWGYRQSTEL